MRHHDSRFVKSFTSKARLLIVTWCTNLHKYRLRELAQEDIQPLPDIMLFLFFAVSPFQRYGDSVPTSMRGCPNAHMTPEPSRKSNAVDRDLGIVIFRYVRYFARTMFLRVRWSAIEFRQNSLILTLLVYSLRSRTRVGRTCHIRLWPGQTTIHKTSNCTKLKILDLILERSSTR